MAVPMKRTTTVNYQLIFLIINTLYVTGEWIEMPQYSDESKVYKVSVNGHNSFYNKHLNNDDQKIVPVSDTKTIIQLLNEYGSADRNTNDRGILSPTVDPFLTSKEFFDSHFNSSDDSFTTNIDTGVIQQFEEETSTPAVRLTLESPTEDPGISSTAIPILTVKNDEKYSSDEEELIKETVKGQDFQNYLPMEMLKKVHQILKSQPSTLKGKIRFLKQFEKDLVTEIEARLSNALAPPRSKRGTHDYYDHDEEIGFPSLEGALMAISFLTFAVYLIRLVMLLFRTPTTTTATTTTVLLGRKRRSMDTLDNKTQEILNYLNTFDHN